MRKITSECAQYAALLVGFAALIFALSLMYGCATTNTTATATSGDALVTASYKTLALAGISYQTVMQTAATLYENGQLGESAKAKVIIYGNAFRGAYQTAVLALLTYMKLDSSDATAAAKVTTALTDLATNLDALQTYAQSVGIAVQEAKE